MERFWCKVDKRNEDECWEWLAGRSVQGYGRFGFERTNQISSRVAWVLTHGEVPKDGMVCHTCDNRGCCNPKHLYLGDAKTNSQDMVNRKRHRGQSVTHCPYGHEYSGNNLWLSNIGGRTCLTCASARSKKSREKTPGVKERAYDANREYHRIHAKEIYERKKRNSLTRKLPK